MATPSTAINRFDLGMTYGEFSLAAQQAGFIGLRLLPPIGVARENANFAKVVVEQLAKKVEDLLRNPKATYKRDDFEWTTDSYDCKEHGAEEVMDDSQIERYGDIIRIERINRNRAVWRLLQSLENEIITTVLGNSNTTAASTAWTTHASADPIEDIRDAIESVITQCGARPNTIAMSDFALRHLVTTDRVESLLKYSGRDDPKMLGTTAALQDLFEVENVLISKSNKNTADEGQTASFSRFFDNTKVWVGHVNDDGMEGDLEDPIPSIGRTIFATTDGNSVPGGMGDGSDAVIVEEYREENRRGGVLRARHKRHVKELHESAGHIITGVTA